MLICLLEFLKHGVGVWATKTSWPSWLILGIPLRRSDGGSFKAVSVSYKWVSAVLAVLDVASWNKP